MQSARPSIKRPSEAELAALAPYVKTLLARKSLVDFCELMHPSYVPARHLELLCNYLERVGRGEISRFIVCMPPGHAKSTTVSRLWPAFRLGQDPTTQIVLASYGQDLAEVNSRHVRDLLNDTAGYPFGTRVSPTSFAASRWNTTAAGQVIAAGTGSGLTGFRANIAILDDPIRDREAAESAAIRESTWSWFTEVLQTRLLPGGSIVIVSTRWHEDDVVGRILASPGADEWTTLVLPAICESESDPLGRKIGEALWPAWYPAESLPSVEKGEISSRAFSALYMQKPAPAGGLLFKKEWLENTYDVLPTSMYTRAVDERRLLAFGPLMYDAAPVPRVVKIQAIDSAWKAGPSSDWSVIVTLVADDINIYVADVVRVRCEYPDLRRLVIDQFRLHDPDLLYVEEASSGYAVVSDLKASTNIPIVGIRPAESKMARAESVSPLFESGRVLFPKTAPWKEQLVTELLSFPASRHDDQTDALCLGVRMIDASIQDRRYAEYFSTLNAGLNR